MSVTPNDVLVHAFRASGMMVEWMTDDLAGDDWLHRPCEGPGGRANCAVWLVGHLALVDRRGLELLGINELPALPDGFEATYGRANDAPEAETFGDPAEALAVFGEHRAVLIEAVAGADDAALAAELPQKWAGNETVYQGLTFMANHTAMHAGHLSTIRRSLGRPPKV